jgi:hypothetical protein
MSLPRWCEFHVECFVYWKDSIVALNRWSTSLEMGRARRVFGLFATQPCWLRFQSLGYCRQNYHVFSAGFIRVVACCRRLRHFEFVGRHFFEREDWDFLCECTFLYLDHVHIEALHPKRFGRPDELDALAISRMLRSSGWHGVSPG